MNYEKQANGFISGAMESKTIICGRCGYSHVVQGEKIEDNVYFPNRTVFVNNNYESCGNPKCGFKFNMVVFGENYISPIFIGYELYLSDKTIIDSNIKWYHKMIEQDKKREKYINDLEDYKDCVYNYTFLRGN